MPFPPQKLLSRLSSLGAGGKRSHAVRLIANFLLGQFWNFNSSNDYEELLDRPVDELTTEDWEQLREYEPHLELVAA
ncbi:hypothetical protein [Nostoc mirabile]|uniref:hypothetical protein n=1 Tax=Nostoc mirabile TaxID=2907820 RepID=UPI0027DF9E14|nr:hypothetical protein [Nostoc mirabile]